MFDLRKLRENLRLRQIDMAEILNCTQSNIAQMERDFKDLSLEHLNILNDKFGEETVMKFAITDESFQKPKRKQVQQEFEQVSRLDDLVSEQQKSIQDLIDMVKKLQAENSKLTDALLRQKII